MGWTCDYPLFYVPQRNVQPISDNLSLFKNFTLKPDQLIVSKTVLKKIFSIKLKKKIVDIEVPCKRQVWNA